MKKLIYLSFLLFLSIRGFADDTKALQTQLDAGAVTLTSGKTYTVTNLRVSNILNLNGATLNISSTSGVAVNLTTKGASIIGGNLIGSWNPTTSYNTNGLSAIKVSADNCSVVKVNIDKFSAYGIVFSPVNNSNIINNKLTNIGYIGIYFDAETAITSGGVISGNTVDRSTLPTATVTQPAIAVRGSSKNPLITTSGWVITNNTINMPLFPKDWTAEGIEVRYMNGGILSNNTISGSSIPISIVRCTFISSLKNIMNNANLEALEFADSQMCNSQYDTINGSTNMGVLIDGAVGCNQININSISISNCKKDCIETTSGSLNISVSNSTFLVLDRAVNMVGSSSFTFSNNIFKGTSTSGVVFYIDNCQGNISITGGSADKFSKAFLAFSNTKLGTTDNVIAKGITLTNIKNNIISYLISGGALGKNISVN